MVKIFNYSPLKFSWIWGDSGCTYYGNKIKDINHFFYKPLQNLTLNKRFVSTYFWFCDHGQHCNAHI
jgi:hypothetical protein